MQNHITQEGGMQKVHFIYRRIEIAEDCNLYYFLDQLIYIFFKYICQKIMCSFVSHLDSLVQEECEEKSRRHTHAIDDDDDDGTSCCWM